MKLSSHLRLVQELRISKALPALPYMLSWRVQEKL